MKIKCPFGDGSDPEQDEECGGEGFVEGYWL